MRTPPKYNRSGLYTKYDNRLEYLYYYYQTGNKNEKLNNNDDLAGVWAHRISNWFIIIIIYKPSLQSIFQYVHVLLSWQFVVCLKLEWQKCPQNMQLWKIKKGEITVFYQLVSLCGFPVCYMQMSELNSLFSLIAFEY